MTGHNDNHVQAKIIDNVPNIYIISEKSNNIL